MAGLVSLVLHDILVLLAAPFQKVSLLWQLAPIFFIWTIMVFYFGTHKHEKLGWNTSLGNGISLFWIVVSGMQYIFASGSDDFAYTKFFLIMVIALYSLFIIVTSFRHSFSDKLTYALASPSPVYYFSAIVLLYAHDVIYVSTSMIIAIFVLFVLLLLFIRLIRAFLPEMKEDDSSDSFASDSFGDVGKNSGADTGMDDFNFEEPTSQEPGQAPPSTQMSLPPSQPQQDNSPNFDDMKF